MQVTYDGEDVQFQGTAPANLGAVIGLLEQTAAGSGRVLLSLKVDGREVLGQELDPVATYTRIEAQTGSTRQLFLRAIDNTLRQLPSDEDAIDPILQSLLSDSWATAFTQLNNFVQTLAPYFELLGTLQHYTQTHKPTWAMQLAVQLKNLETAFVKILKLSETQQVAELTSALNIEFRAFYTESISFIKATVRPSFVE